MVSDKEMIRDGNRVWKLKKFKLYIFDERKMY